MWGRLFYARGIRDIIGGTMTETNVTLNSILDQFRDDARNNRDLGDRFERMMQQYFPRRSALCRPVLRSLDVE